MSDPHEALHDALGSLYELRDVLGVGGMGTVYLAHDRKHDRQVALKTIHPELLSRSGIERFQREIQVTARLQHPHILPLLDSGVAADVPYYVMPFVEGESLADRLTREKQLPIDEALLIAREVADALGYAHAVDIIHRDIKPGNIMLSGGHAAVTDFGIARAISAAGGGSITSTGVSIGTPNYMSPEQATDAKAADGRSDVYSLGCVLYEMLAGQPPFTGATAESIVRQHIAVEPPPVTNYRTSVPAPIAAALMRALAKAPADRFNPATKFGEALAASASSGEIMAEARSRTRRVRNVLLAVVSIYLAGSWGVLTVVQNVAETAGLPPWISPLAILLLLLGLPMVITTAFVQAGTSHGGSTDPGSTPVPGDLGSGAPRGRTPTGPRTSGSSGWTSKRATRRLFTWRNVIGGGVLALALWGLMAAGWLLLGDRAEAPAGSETGASSDQAERLAVAQPGEPPLEAASDSTSDDQATAESDEATSEVPSEEVPVGAAPPPPAPPPAAADPARFSYATSVNAAARAREAADAAGARGMRPALVAIADSLWGEATRVAATGDFTRARGLIDRSKTAYDQAMIATAAAWGARLDSARSAVRALRGTADPSSDSYGTAERLLQDAGQAADAEDYAAAFASLREAARAYREAARAEPSSPVADESPSAPEERPATPEPAPRERVRAIVEDLRAALEQEDLGRLRRVWVSLTAQQLRGFESLFEDGRDLRVTIVVNQESIAVTENGISVNVTTTYEYFNEGTGRRERPPAFEQRLVIAPRDGRWVIVDG